jgi:hypothetical protein
MPRGWMHDQTGRLVYDDKVLVCVDNLDRNVLGQQLDRGSWRDVHLDRVSGARPVALPDLLAVYLYRTSIDQRGDTRSTEPHSIRQDGIEAVFEIHIDVNPNSIR